MSTLGTNRSVLTTAASLMALAAAGVATLAQPPDAASPAKLGEWLLQVPEITLEGETGKTASAVLAEARQDREALLRHYSANSDQPRQLSADAPMLPPPIPLAQSKRWEALGLEPITMASNRQLGPEVARALEVVAMALRRSPLVSAIQRDGSITRPDNSGSEDLSRNLAGVIRSAALGGSSYGDEDPSNPTWPVPGLMQLLCAEDIPIRLALVDQLGKRNGPASTKALAHLAVYDLSATVRSSSVEALKKRPWVQYQSILLDSFQHPLPSIAARAADALVAVRQDAAIPELRKLLDGPDLIVRTSEDGKPMVRELVRINHLKNCLLCHAPSLDQKDLVRGRIPPPDQPLPVAVAYYQQHNRSVDDIFVRADITYLRQDFSVMLPVRDAKPWPEMQRFDFLVRTRPATAEELTAQKEKKGHSPQREAVRHALDGLK